MGISERKYASAEYDEKRRGGSHWRGKSFNTWLIIANIVVFVVEAFVSQRSGTDPIHKWGHFSTDWLLYPHLQFWRVVTFQFLHVNIVHIGLNMLGLWVFGAEVERHLGFKKYAAFYLVCGICGALAYLILNLGGYIAAQAGLGSVPGLLFNNRGTPLVGASAGVFGVIMAAAYIAPNSLVQLMFPPISLRLRTFAYGYVAIAALNLFFGGRNAGGDAAHIGGAIAGFFFVRNSHLLRDFFDVFDDSRKPAASGARPKMRDTARQEEVDRVLRKVHEQGLHSLTDKEQRVLRSETERGTGA